jgi:hypothetical protein
MFIYDDNFLNNEQIFEIQKILKKENNLFFWDHLPNTNGEKNYPKLKNKKINVSDDEQFAHSASLFDDQFSIVHDLGKDILNIFAKKNNIEVKKILRVKSNILNKTNKKNHINPPHIDIHIPHFVFLYYVNDSDGDTVLFNEMYSFEKEPELTINKRIKPKAGSAIVFNGFNYHSSSAPIDTNERIVININFIGKL